MKMKCNLDNNIRNMLGNLDLIPEMINPKGFTFFGDTILSRRTAKVYQLICNISQYHETTSEAIRWLCLHLELNTNINNFYRHSYDIEDIYNNIKTYLYVGGNIDEETGAFYVFESKHEEYQFLKKIRKAEKYSDVVLIGINAGFDIYETAELLLASIFGEVDFSYLGSSDYERPIIAAIIYAKFVSLQVIPIECIKNNNPDNYEP